VSDIAKSLFRISLIVLEAFYIYVVKISTVYSRQNAAMRP